MAQRQATAAFVLSGVLFALALPSPRSAPRACRVPSELEQRDGDTIAVHCVDEPSEASPLRGPARQLFGLRIDPNCARVGTLESLPGIGPSRARAIVAARRQRPFERADELLRVHGIGPKTLARLRPLLSVRLPGDARPSVDSPECRSSSIREGRDGPEERR